MGDERGDLLTIDEMIARAELEPSLRDFYVEGRTDVPVYAAFFAHHNLDVAVFAISDRLVVEPETVALYDQDYGERAKLIAAASETASKSADAASRLTFVIDSDWANVTGPIPLERSCLAMTDLPSLEHYFFEGPGFSHMIAAGLGHYELDPKAVRADMKKILRDIAAARLVLKSLGVAPLDRIANLIRRNTNPPSVDSAEIVRRSLARLGASRPAGAEGHARTTSEYREMLDTVAHDGRGHDIALVLVAYLRTNGHFADYGVIEAMMRSSTTPSSLCGFAFFQHLESRARAA